MQIMQEHVGLTGESDEHKSMLIGENLALAIAAVLSGTLGVLSLYISWSRRPQHKRAAVILGWALISASLYFWIRFGGAEFGPVLAFIQLSLMAWAFVLTNKHVRPNKGRQQQPGTVNLPRFQALARHAALFLVAVPLAGVAGTFLVLVVAKLLPWNDVDRMAFSILTIPVVWGLAVYWTCADTRLWRPTAGIVAIGSAVSAILFS